eukprot:g10706.t1
MDTHHGGTTTPFSVGGPNDGLQAKRLLEDPEVKFIRDLQAKLELVDGRSGRRVALPKLLKPGGALHDADLLCIGEIHDSPGDHAVQRLLLDALTYALFLELRSSEGVAAAAPRGRTPQRLGAGSICAS